MSSSQSMDSPCDTNTMANDYGDIELPNLNLITNSRSNISLQNYGIENLNTNMNMNMSLANGLPTLAWPSNLLSSNLSMNALILKALQLRTFNQQREAANFDLQFIPQANSHVLNEACPTLQASSSRTYESLHQQQQAPPPQEQPFNLDSMW